VWGREGSEFHSVEVKAKLSSSRFSLFLRAQCDEESVRMSMRCKNRIIGEI
jgi:hypothetical protein